jgi:hypothetical protein
MVFRRHPFFSFQTKEFTMAQTKAQKEAAEQAADELKAEAQAKEEAAESQEVTVTCCWNPNVSLLNGEKLSYGDHASVPRGLAEFLIDRGQAVEGEVKLPSLDEPEDPNERQRRKQLERETGWDQE